MRISQQRFEVAYGSRIQVLSRVTDQPIDEKYLYDKYLFRWQTKRDFYTANGNPVLLYFEYISRCLAEQSGEEIKRSAVMFIEDITRMSVYYIKERIIIEILYEILNSDNDLDDLMNQQIKRINELRSLLFRFVRNSIVEELDVLKNSIKVIFDVAQTIETKISNHAWK